jgi:Ca2+-dependent lipid-binding protein
MKDNIKSTRVLANKKDPIWNEDLYQLVTSGKNKLLRRINQSKLTHKK